MCPDWINTNLGLITLGKIHTRIIQPRIFHPRIISPRIFHSRNFHPRIFHSRIIHLQIFFTTGLFTPRLITSRYFTTENVFIKIGVKKSLRKKCCVGGTPLNSPFHKKIPALWIPIYVEGFAPKSLTGGSTPRSRMLLNLNGSQLVSITFLN